MGFFDKVKEIISDNDDELDDYQDDYRNDAAFDAGIPRAERSVSSIFDRGDREERAEARAPRRQKSDKVVNIHTTTQLQVVLVKPERYEEAAAIADNLNEKRTVVLNLESTNRDIARRLLDFLSGVAYANNGQIKRVANSTYIITPYNVDVMGDLIDELENNGMFM